MKETREKTEQFHSPEKAPQATQYELRCYLTAVSPKINSTSRK